MLPEAIVDRVMSNIFLCLQVRIMHHYVYVKHSQDAFDTLDTNSSTWLGLYFQILDHDFLNKENFQLEDQGILFAGASFPQFTE